MIEVGAYNLLKVARLVKIGAYLDDGRDGILLPNKYVPEDTKVGDEIRVFIYHDSESRIIATTEHPLGVIGDIVMLQVESITPQGAFMNWGLTKDIFVPKSKQRSRMYKGERYLVKIYLDEQTGRVAATEKIDGFLSNDVLSVKEMERVDLLIYRRTDIGYFVIINNIHTGVLHYNEVFRELEPGEKLEGFIKKISDQHKIDVILGKPGYEKVSEESENILKLLLENNGYLPYNDKSAPEEIYRFFGMSKKTFKMTVGGLLKQGKVRFTKTGIQLTGDAA